MTAVSPIKQGADGCKSCVAGGAVGVPEVEAEEFVNAVEHVVKGLS